MRAPLGDDSDDACPGHHSFAVWTIFSDFDLVPDGELVSPRGVTLKDEDVTCGNLSRDKPRHGKGQPSQPLGGSRGARIRPRKRKRQRRSAVPIVAQPRGLARRKRSSESVQGVVMLCFLRSLGVRDTVQECVPAKRRSTASLMRKSDECRIHRGRTECRAAAAVGRKGHPRDGFPDGPYRAVGGCRRRSRSRARRHGWKATPTFGRSPQIESVQLFDDEDDASARKLALQRMQ